jgi:O-antigen ligase
LVSEFLRPISEVVRERTASPTIQVEATLAVAAALAAVLFTVAAVDAAEATSEATGLLLALVLGIGAVVAGLAVLEPWVGLLAWLVVMPILNASRLGITVGGVFVTHSTLLLACLALGTFLAARSGRRPLARLSWPVAGLAIVAASLAIASGLGAPDAGIGTTIALHGVVEPVVLAVLVLLLADGRERVVALAVAMIASVSIATAYNLERLVRITVDLAVAQSDRTGFARFTYYNVGIYGDMVVMTLPLAVGLFLAWAAHGTHRFRRALVLGATGLLAVGLYLTFTKGPWLGGLIAVAGLLAMSAVTWRRRAAILIVGAMVATIVVPYPLYAIRAVDAGLADQLLPVLQGIQGGNRADSWDPETAEGEVSITERLLATEAAARMALDHPLLGVGPGSFATAYASTYKPAAATRSLQSAHDFLADVAAEFGLPLMVVIIAGFAAAGMAAIRLARRAPPLTKSLALAFGAATAGFLIVGFSFGVDLYRPWRVMNSDVLFAALLLAALGVLARTEGPNRPVLDRLREDQPGEIPTV